MVNNPGQKRWDTWLISPAPRLFHYNVEKLSQTLLFHKNNATGRVDCTVHTQSIGSVPRFFDRVSSSESTPKDDYIGILFPVFQDQSCKAISKNLDAVCVATQR